MINIRINPEAFPWWLEILKGRGRLGAIPSLYQRHPNDHTQWHLAGGDAQVRGVGADTRHYPPPPSPPGWNSRVWSSQQGAVPTGTRCVYPTSWRTAFTPRRPPDGGRWARIEGCPGATTRLPDHSASSRRPQVGAAGAPKGSGGYRWWW